MTSSDPSTRAPLAARLQLLTSAALFSTGGAAIKATQLAGWQVASCRSLLAALTLLVAFPAARRWPRPSLLALSLAYSATMLLYVLANKLTTAASTIFLQGTAPLYILLLGPRWLGERLRRSDILFMVAVATGLVLLVSDLGGVTATAPNPRLGNLLAALSGLSWAITLVGLRRLERRADGGEVGATGSGPVSLVWGNLLTALIGLPFTVTHAWPAGGQGLHDAAIVIYLGILQVGLGYVFLTRGISRVQALEASLLLLLEPVLNPVWAWLVHGERPGNAALVGAAIILGATVVRTWFAARRSTAPAT
jgi:DME family drug/metabolite transporter